MTKSDAYKEEIIDPGDRASQLAKDICFQSHRNCKAVSIIPHQRKNFRGPVGFLWQPHILDLMKLGYGSKWIMCEEVENDGAGGKPQFFSLVGTPEVFRGLGWEIITMVADDFARTGRLPCIIDNEVNVKRITKKNFHLFKAMMEGYGAALKLSNLVNITGEVAIMKHSITSFCDTGDDSEIHLTWGSSCIGLACYHMLIDGSKIKPGMPVVGFLERGYRCNGGTFFTNLLLAKFGPELEKIRRNIVAMEFVKKLTTPSISYAKTISRLVGWRTDGSTKQAPLADIRGIAHITGGGMKKFAEILPKGIGAKLDTMPEPPEVLLDAQIFSVDTDYELSDYQAHTTLHGGCGMILVCANEKSVSAVIKEARKDGIVAQQIGQTDKSGAVVIYSRFLQRKSFSLTEV